MTIVVTGAAGFVGTALVDTLAREGRTVVALDRAPPALASRPNLRVVVGDLGNPAVRADALSGGCGALVHLATLPGGAAEADPAGSRRVNLDAMYDLLDDVSGASSPVRVVYASSIAVFGDPLPLAGVDDQTPLAPRLVYGVHKAMMELAVAALTRRGAIDGVTVRLSGILARPQGASGLKSAFMSDVFHALHDRQRFVSPVGPTATLWVQSLDRCVANLHHALAVPGALMPEDRAVTLPAVRVSMADLVAEIAQQVDASSDLVTYQPDAGLERAFGRHPTLATPAAEAAGFAGDSDGAALVAAALARIARRG